LNYELFIAGRYLSSKRRTGFISLITVFSAVGIMIGVAALVIVLSVANGFQAEVRNRIIGVDSHLKLTKFHEAPLTEYEKIIAQVSKLEHVLAASPYIMGKGLLRYGKSVEATLMKAVDEETVGDVNDLPRIIVAGMMTLSANVYSDGTITTNNNPSDQLEVKIPESGLHGIILGKQLAFRLGATVGDSIIAISPTEMTSMFSAPQMKRFMVTGVFETGIFEYDDTYSYIGLDAGQDFFNLGNGVTGIDFNLDNMENAEIVKVKIQDDLGYPYYVRTWYDNHRTLFRWMKLEKWLYTILLSLIILVAAFNIISSQIMLVLEKKREIGILKAIGMNRKGIIRIFLYEGIIIGTVGTILGLTLGWAVCYGQQTFQWLSLPGDVYFLNVLPVLMQPLDFLIITIVSIILTIAATAYPAMKAGSLDPVEVIRYE